MVEIIPTVVPHSVDDIQKAAAMYRGFAPVLHVDFADGLFAPNTTWLPSIHEGTSLALSGVVLEAHLMVQEPQEIGERLARAGYRRIIGHVEAMAHVGETLAAWRESGAREVGLGILARTPLEALDPYMTQLDMVQMMTISKIGVQGLPFDERSPTRVAALHRVYPRLLISVDGGVGEKTIGLLAAAGARRFCAGSVLSKSSDPASTYRTLIALAESGVE
ncbi:MAG TPA: hypothetical protein VJG64_03045 [Candidatus Paceibacterota bacterium]